jgi:hypothetical protein
MRLRRRKAHREVGMTVVAMLDNSVGRRRQRNPFAFTDTRDTSISVGDLAPTATCDWLQRPQTGWPAVLHSQEQRIDNAMEVSVKPTPNLFRSDFLADHKG